MKLTNTYSDDFRNKLEKFQKFVEKKIPKEIFTTYVEFLDSYSKSKGQNLQNILDEGFEYSKEDIILCFKFLKANKLNRKLFENIKVNNYNEIPVLVDKIQKIKDDYENN